MRPPDPSHHVDPHVHTRIRLPSVNSVSSSSVHPREVYVGRQRREVAIFIIVSLWRSLGRALVVDVRLSLHRRCRVVSLSLMLLKVILSLMLLRVIRRGSTVSGYER